MRTTTRAILGGLATASVVGLLYLAAWLAKFEMAGMDLVFTSMILVGGFAGWRFFGKRWDELMSPFRHR